MTQRKSYRYALVPDGVGPKSGALFLKLVKVPIPGSDLPRSSRHGNRIHTQKSEKTVRHVESGNGNSIFSGRELSI
jgi:hypothetical protein